MTRASYTVERKTGRTLIADRRRAPFLEAMCQSAIKGLFALARDNDWPALSRALVQEAMRHDASLRGAHEAATWGAAQVRKVDPPEAFPGRMAAAQALFAPTGEA